MSGILLRARSIWTAAATWKISRDAGFSVSQAVLCRSGTILHTTHALELSGQVFSHSRIVVSIFYKCRCQFCANCIRHAYPQVLRTAFRLSRQLHKRTPRQKCHAIMRLSRPSLRRSNVPQKRKPGIYSGLSSRLPCLCSLCVLISAT